VIHAGLGCLAEKRLSLVFAAIFPPISEIMASSAESKEGFTSFSLSCFTKGDKDS
jgi:hypothetical protein